MAEPKHPTCLDVSTFVRPDIYVCGPECPTPEQEALDRARDARRRVYAANLRRAAARALDRYIAAMVSDGPGTPVPDGASVIDSIGDYMESRLRSEPPRALRGGCSNCGMPSGANSGSCDECTASRLQHSGDYGVPAEERCPTCGERRVPAAVMLDGSERPCIDRWHRGPDYGATETVSCPLCPATSQDIAAHYADYHPEHRNCGREDCPGPGHLFGPRQQCAGHRSAETHPFRGHDGAPCLFPTGVGTSGYCDRPESDPVHRVDQRWCSCTGNTATRMHPYGVAGCRYGPREGASEMPRVEGPS